MTDEKAPEDVTAEASEPSSVSSSENAGTEPAPENTGDDSTPKAKRASKKTAKAEPTAGDDLDDEWAVEPVDHYGNEIITVRQRGMVGDPAITTSLDKLKALGRKIEAL